MLTHAIANDCSYTFILIPIGLAAIETTTRNDDTRDFAADEPDADA